MASPNGFLPFEQDIIDMEDVLAKLESKADAHVAAGDEIRRIKKELTKLIQKIYSNLTPWDTILVSRHPNRPQTVDYINLIFDEFVELHGDRAIGDDRAIRSGFARLGDYRVLLVGHQKGHTLKERGECLYGCAHPEGYRKALAKMKLAAKFRLPVVCLIDTPGAYPGIGAEERGQAQLIATNLFEMSRLPTPVICVVIGEGGSGGALGIGIGDRVSMLEHAYYSVISPEGCAGILWKSANEETKPLAAGASEAHCPGLVQAARHRRHYPRTLGRRPPRPPSHGQHFESLSSALSARPDAHAHSRPPRQALPKVPRDGRF